MKRIQAKIINVTAPLDYISFEQELAIGRIVREQVEVGRVIVLGGRDITIKDILKAVVVKENNIVGIDCQNPVYIKRVMCAWHLGYGVNRKLK